MATRGDSCRSLERTRELARRQGDYLAAFRLFVFFFVSLLTPSDSEACHDRRRFDGASVASVFVLPGVVMRRLLRLSIVCSALPLAE